MNKVVGSAIIKDSKGKILAVRLNKEKKGGVWVPPGGKLEEGETLRESIIREVEEELGIKIEILRLAGISEEQYGDEFWVFIFYEARIISGTPRIREPGKILEIEWIDRNQLKNSNNIHWF